MKLAEKARSRLVTEIRELVRFLAVAAPAYFAFTTIAFAAFHIPSESMVPQLEVGDRVVVSKFAYGYSRHSLPLGLDRFTPASEERLFGRIPARGDVIVFMHPKERRVMIKRLIGLPGDVIAVSGGVLSVNGQPAMRGEGQDLTRLADGVGLESATRYCERLADGGAHLIHEFSDEAPLDSFGPYTVPEGQLFAMGDNRDNSLDSRAAMGPFPIENLIGRAEFVYFSMPRFDWPAQAERPANRLFVPLSAAKPGKGCNAP